MNWKIKTVLLFAKLKKPLDPVRPNIKAMRKEAEKAAQLGSVLFDKKINIARITDTKAGELPIRIYNNSEEKNQPVILYFHGGGFVLYGLNSHDYVCRRLCAMNHCIVVSVDYRLAPEFSFPAAHEDGYTAIHWVRENIADLGGNADKLIVAGDSAGGNLAACMAHYCKQNNIPLLAQIMVYPWIDGKLNNPSIDRNGEGYMLTKETMFWFQKQYTPRVEDQCHPKVSPCYETDFSNMAPALILTAEFDPLIDDGKKYYHQLKEYNNHVVYYEYPQLIHGFFNLPRADKNALKAYYDIKSFIQEIIKTEATSIKGG